MAGVSAYLLGVMTGFALPFLYFYFDWRSDKRKRVLARRGL